MNKKKLGDFLSERFDFTKVQGREIVDLIFEEITKSLENGKDVRISGFGKFQAIKRKVRSFKMPNSSEAKNTEEFRIRFSPFKALKQRINKK